MKGFRVELQELSKRFGVVEVLKGLSLEVKPGELVALLGPSGCGKTTTLLLVAGLYRPSRGRILFDGRPVDHLHPKDRDIGMVFQTYALYPHMTLEENIAFPLRLKRVPPREIKERVGRIAELLGIGDLLGRRPAEVSGGQQQRAALARALVKEPGLLLLDEPLSNLDARIRLQARTEIRRLQLDLGITTLLVTHDQGEALAMADRVAVLAEGVLQQYDTPETLYHRPANTFVAHFIGDPPMNLYRGRFTPQRFEGEVVWPFPEGWTPPFLGEGFLGVRPENLQVVWEGEGLPARVVLREALGREGLLTLALEAGGQVKALVPGDVPFRPGDGVRVRYVPEALHFFDPQGRRVGDGVAPARGA
ncbi:Glycerol-3-phosphate-transporting ATPase (plasmid) [Thermus thermophilus SG0.5JP17-16]|uniref:Glycerol-3-phosphate-transporting ATPase n=1 Tax=Thermus thermophilus (strain SG0.5JP17-16) TaxID=762633 RepID=F6DJ32_THETG|nr:ABC transporter ATP-binding protein [Thermus thermophilus]AEG34429.1 Glycerol-3-phosphate-transporting ATPase [Thermus thermophilus SG0.5JP17-16]